MIFRIKNSGKFTGKLSYPIKEREQIILYVFKKYPDYVNVPGSFAEVAGNAFYTTRKQSRHATWPICIHIKELYRWPVWALAEETEPYH